MEFDIHNYNGILATLPECYSQWERYIPNIKIPSYENLVIKIMTSVINIGIRAANNTER